MQRTFRCEYVLMINIDAHLATAAATLRESLSQPTLIPNMAGFIGVLTRLFNLGVYEMHNPHDLVSFLEGHRKAGMAVLSGGYLGSTNFGMLSSCFNERRGLSWHAYVLLTWLLTIEYLECKLGGLPRKQVVLALYLCDYAGG